jgi:hypothetical protein
MVCNAFCPVSSYSKVELPRSSTRTGAHVFVESGKPP